jgi:hypothetical protein
VYLSKAEESRLQSPDNIDIAKLESWLREPRVEERPAGREAAHRLAPLEATEGLAVFLGRA